MNKSMKSSAQGGFTLIELIVVIVILGILAATALPKFANLGGDARLASVQAAKGALSATAAMTHGKWLINPTASVTVEGTTVAMNATSGYPTGTLEFATAAGLSDADYVLTVTATTVKVKPKSASNEACSVTYTTPTTANTAPTYSALPTAAQCE